MCYCSVWLTAQIGGESDRKAESSAPFGDLQIVAKVTMSQLPALNDVCVKSRCSSGFTCASEYKPTSLWIPATKQTNVPQSLSPTKWQDAAVQITRIKKDYQISEGSNLLWQVSRQTSSAASCSRFVLICTPPFSGASYNKAHVHSGLSIMDN